MKVSIRRVSLSSLGRVGCLLGAAAAFLPSLLCGLLGVALVGVLHDWLQGWQDLPVDLLGQEVARLNLVQLLGLDGVLRLSEIVASASGAVLFLAVLLLALVSGVLLAAIVAFVGLVYNLLASVTGGVVVEMVPVAEQRAPARPATTGELET